MFYRANNYYKITTFPFENLGCPTGVYPTYPVSNFYLGRYWSNWWKLFLCTINIKKHIY